MVRPVELGEQVGSMWIVEKGVSAGDSVVAEGVQKVKDGAPVNPKPVQADSVPDQASATHKGG